MNRLGAGMQSLGGLLGRLLGGNPLIRTSDRLEVAAVLSAFVIAVLTVPLSVSVGVAVHDEQSSYYAEQARHRHQVTAIAASDSSRHRELVGWTNIVVMKWTYDGMAQSSRASLPDPVDAGDRVQVWVDDDGDLTLPPTSGAQAAQDGVSIALALWLAVAAVLAGAVMAMRLWLNRSRETGWEHELELLLDKGGGHSRNQM